MTNRRPSDVADDAPTLPHAVDRESFLHTIHHRTGAPMSVVRFALTQLEDAGDVRVEPNPRMPSGFAVIPCPGLASHLADDLKNAGEL